MQEEGGYLTIYRWLPGTRDHLGVFGMAEEVILIFKMYFVWKYIKIIFFYFLKIIFNINIWT